MSPVSSTHPCIVNTSYIGAFSPSNISFKTIDWASDWTWANGYYDRRTGTTDRKLAKEYASIVIAPNPINRNESFTIRWDDYLSQAILEIYNLSGVLVKQLGIEGKQATLSTEDLAKGLYIITIQQDGQRLATDKLRVR